MREIKFRGKADSGWVYGAYFYNGIKAYILIVDDNDSNDQDDFTMHAVENVAQYTGLNDKNGKEIYEGDKIRVEKLHFETSGKLPETFTVKFDNCAFELWRGNEPLMGLRLSCVKECEVLEVQDVDK